jgi:hypothetical protein
VSAFRYTSLLLSGGTPHACVVDVFSVEVKHAESSDDDDDYDDDDCEVRHALSLVTAVWGAC